MFSRCEEFIDSQAFVPFVAKVRAAAWGGRLVYRSTKHARIKISCASENSVYA